MTPEEKLCSRSWRLRNSAGVLWSILSFGLLTGVNFLIRGVKSKNKLWIGMGIGFLLVGVGVMVTSSMIDSGTKAAPKSSPELTIWGWVMFTSFIGGVIASFVTNKKWLIWKAHVDDRKWYAKAGASQPASNTSPPMATTPTLQRRPWQHHRHQCLIPSSRRTWRPRNTLPRPPHPVKASM